MGVAELEYESILRTVLGIIEYLKPIRDIVWTIFSKFKFTILRTVLGRIAYLKFIQHIVWTIFSKFKFSLKFEKKLKNAKACTVKLTEALKNCPKY
jgi:hypothetical protein